MKSEKVRMSLFFILSLLLFTSAAAETVYVTQANIGTHRTLRNGNTYWFDTPLSFGPYAAPSGRAVSTRPPRFGRVAAPKSV